MNKILVIDGNNIAHIHYHLQKNRISNMENAVDHSITQTLFGFKYLHDKHNPSTTIIAFDEGATWREHYTKSGKAITNRVYKANRSQKKTRKELEAKKFLNKRIKELSDLLRHHTKLYILQQDGIEADDFVGAICDMYRNEHDTEVVVVSGDKDYLQFLKHDNVSIDNPRKGDKPRNLEEWNNDAELMLFEKCIRGDNGDNVRSSYPRVRKTDIVAAYYDDVKKSNMMNHTFTETVFCDIKKEYVDKTYRVGDLFKENALLMRLDNQPKDIKKRIRRVIIDEMGEEKKLNFVRFRRYMAKNEMGNVTRSATEFVPMLNNMPQ